MKHCINCFPFTLKLLSQTGFRRYNATMNMITKNYWSHCLQAAGVREAYWKTQTETFYACIYSGNGIWAETSQAFERSNTLGTDVKQEVRDSLHKDLSRITA